MSHGQERARKNCLNCNAQVHGRFCQICGQENLEPQESFWHLVTHFFNDITHFDGKFFSSLKLLFFHPGFLSAEYKRGRRSSYLNPVRMYVFTSFLFFLVFFSVYHFENLFGEGKPKPDVIAAIAGADSSHYSNFTLAVKSMDSAQAASFSRAISKGQVFPKKDLLAQVEKLRLAHKSRFPNTQPLKVISRLDSSDRHYFFAEVNSWDSNMLQKFTKALHDGKALSKAELEKYLDSLQNGQFIRFGKKYVSQQQYDSLKKAGKLDAGWLSRKFYEKGFDINKRYGDSESELTTMLVSIVLHYFPQMLFISLPLYALFLALLYYRHKDHYLVSHGIFSVHIYIFYFIVLLLFIGLNKLDDAVHLGIVGMVQNFLWLILFFYEYKAMRYYYGQSRKKTMIKFFIAIIFRFVLIFILFALLLMWSILKL